MTARDRGDAIAGSRHEALARRFQRFAETECRESSPLYEHLASAIAADESLLALAAEAPPGQPVPNLFLAAVRFLLLRDPAVPLAHFYPDLTPAAGPVAGAYPAFRAFCLTDATLLQQLLAHRRVQTNEVGRCAYLLPAFTRVAALAGGRPLALIEIGTSAGLNLMWDHYGYHYGHGAVYGDARSPVQLACVLRGDVRPPLPRPLPTVAIKIGVDLHVVDLAVPDEVLWLRALVWPEHRERATRLLHAIELARRHPPRLASGDGVAVLPDLLRNMPEDVAVCVFHTHTLNQLPRDARDRLSAILAEHSVGRPLYRVSAEWLDAPAPQLELTTWHAGRGHPRLLGHCDPHGSWLEWLDDGR